jgi:hypothetical protein
MHIFRTDKVSRWISTACIFFVLTRSPDGIVLHVYFSKYTCSANPSGALVSTKNIHAVLFHLETLSVRKIYMQCYSIWRPCQYEKYTCSANPSGALVSTKNIHAVLIHLKNMFSYILMHLIFFWLLLLQYKT